MESCWLTVPDRAGSWRVFLGFVSGIGISPGIGPRLLIRAPNNAGNAMSPLGEAVRVRHAQPAFGMNPRN